MYLQELILQRLIKQLMIKLVNPLSKILKVFITRLPFIFIIIFFNYCFIICIFPNTFLSLFNFLISFNIFIIVPYNI